MREVDRDLARDVGARVAHLRGRRSVRSFARAVGLNHSALISMERGSTLPRADTLLRISELEGVTIDWIMRGNAAYRRMLKTREKRAAEAARGVDG